MENDLTKQERYMENPVKVMDDILSNIKKEEFIKKLKDVHNKDVDGYIRFQNYILGEFYQSKNGEGSLFRNFERNYNETGDMRIALSDSLIFHILGCLKYGKILKVDENLFSLFEKTSNKISKRNLPFEQLIIPCNLKICNRFNPFCILITKTFILTRKREELHIMVFSIDEKDDSEWWDSFYIGEEGITNTKIRRDFSGSSFSEITLKEDLKFQKEIGMIICNILDFVNHPEVSIKLIKAQGNSISRIKRGKFPNLDKGIIEISGKLYKYIYEDLPKQHNSPSISFWVRGHYVHFWNKKRWKGIYSKEIYDLKEKGYQMDSNGIISKWILPYIKGKGILTNKKYNLKNAN